MENEFQGLVYKQTQTQSESIAGTLGFRCDICSLFATVDDDDDERNVSFVLCCVTVSAARRIDKNVTVRFIVQAFSARSYTFYISRDPDTKLTGGSGGGGGEGNQFIGVRCSGDGGVICPSKLNYSDAPTKCARPRLNPKHSNLTWETYRRPQTSRMTSPAINYRIFDILLGMVR